MTLLSLHCRNSEALRCSVLQTGSIVYGSLSITSFESVIKLSGSLQALFHPEGLLAG